jgi:hypothetical protein
MPTIDRGTELDQIGEIVPGAIQSGRRTSVANQGRGTPTIPVEDVDYGIIRLTALDGYTRNNAGNPITGYDLGGVDAVFSTIVAYLYPGGASDDNDVQFEVPVPQDMDLTDPQITVILHFLIPLPPFTPAPIPGGLPVGCNNAILYYNGTDWIAAVLVTDSDGTPVIDTNGDFVYLEC